MSRRQGIALAAVPAGLLGVLAVWSQADVPGSSLWLIAIDITVGLAFIVSAMLSPAATRERLLFGSVGSLWLLGSVFPAAGLTHQAVLAIALLAFPSGRLAGIVRWILAGLAVPLAFGLIPQPGVAVLLATIGLVAARGSALGRFPAASAITLAVVLAGSWWLSRGTAVGYNPQLALVAYQATLLMIAAAFPFAAREAIVSRARVVDRILGEETTAGLAGFGVVLADALRDPSILGPPARRRSSIIPEPAGGIRCRVARSGDRLFGTHPGRPDHRRSRRLGGAHRRTTGTTRTRTRSPALRPRIGQGPLGGCRRPSKGSNGQQA